jgi:DNA repair protein RecO (recombination protein O)
MIFSTKGIVLRTVKYGDTSIIAGIFTEQFGLQSYLINGIRSNSKSARSKSGLFQPGALLDMEVYHNELKNLQRIKEARWHKLYQHIYFDILKSSVALFMIEMLQKCLREPEPLEELFAFTEDVLLELDEATDPTIIANLPLFFAVHLSSFLGHQITDNYSEKNSVFNLQEGQFEAEAMLQQAHLEYPYSSLIAEILRAQQPQELMEIKTNRQIRLKVLLGLIQFYQIHLSSFGNMKSLDVLQQMMQ